jgi:hypothetical protein
MGFDTTIAMFERAKTVHDLNRAATVIGIVPPPETKTLTMGTGRQAQNRKEFHVRDTEH